jgi:phosphoribosylglycinamide formyltransferase 1
MFAPCRDAGVELVAMAGFLKHVLIPADFAGRVMNIHPALIPAFCGAGFYGERVHRAALEYGVKVSGCTVHFVDNHYDHGPIILQRTVPVHPDDTPQTLAARVFEQECQAYPEAIRLYAAGRLRIAGRLIVIT